MPVSGTLRWGIASAGLISHDFTTAIGTHQPGEHQVVAVAARKLPDAQKFAATHKIATAYGSYKELSEDLSVDVVYVGTINTTHFELAKMYLEAGKHVLCEKPMCMNVRETKELVEVARVKNLFLMEAVWSRCLPSYQAIRDLLAEGKIGEVKQVEASFGQVIDTPRLHSKELGGGTVYDLGIYTIQFAQLVLGPEMPRVVAGGHLGPQGCEESSSTTLLYQGGNTATITTHSRVSLPCEARIIGTKGTITVPFPFWTATKLVTSIVTRTQTETSEEKPTEQEFALPTGASHPYNFTNSANMAFESGHVRDCILGGKTESTLVSLDETITMATIIEETRKQIGVTFAMS